MPQRATIVHGRVPGDLLHPRLIRMNGDPGDINPADLNPIEMAFAKLKQLLRSLNARTIDQLWRAIGSVCSVFTPDECWNFFRHCGYAPASS